MRAILITAAMAAAVTILSAGAAAAAAPPPPARTCVGLAGTPEAAAVWWGQFSGGQMQSFGDGAVAPRAIATEGCFPTERACERWLYRMKGAYSALPPASSTGCRRGYRGIY